MKIEWSANAKRDIERLRAFVAAYDRRAADRIIDEIISNTENIGRYPELGSKVEKYLPLDVRRLIVGEYEMRYMVAFGSVRIIRIWHSRELR